ncbi:TlpA disulfide reductase family protein [uncultured Aquimarina sp.]|uniref:TlpA disulfide reductase family protein n=1 Tax=uncultured Aquimarina sp. TaxID=575652 RepID=UPI00262940F7|nr:TlpA disulfide reductase family protein [uncultured Aquimarina sp.]
MKRSYFLVMSALVFIVFSCKQKQQNEQTDDFNTETEGYQIVGNLKNIPDSTWIYINKDNKIVDSTQIIGEKFEFTGFVDEPSSFFMMVGKTNREYFYMWAENVNITVTGKKGDLKNSAIVGGKAQKDSDIFNQRMDSVSKGLDWIEKKYRYAKNISNETHDSIAKAQSKLLAKSEQISKDFIREFPDSYVSVHSLYIYNTTWDKQVVSELYNNLSDRMKKSKNGLTINKFLSLPETPKTGEKYIDFELPNTSGELVKLSDIKGKYVLVEFWASWCGPCIEDNPKLVKTYNTYKEKGFEIIGVSLDTNKKHWLKAIEKGNLPWMNVGDMKGSKTEVAQIYGVNGIPDNFLMDEQGIIVAKTLRGNALENKLKELFQ